MSKTKLNSSAAIIHRPVRFGDQLSWEDRKTLRGVVRKVHRHYFRDAPTDVQCDEFIDKLGPIAQAKMLRFAIGGQA